MTTKVQLCQREQADRGFRDHVGTSVEQFEVAFGDAEMPLPLVRAVENEAVRVAEGEGRGIIGNEDADGFGGAAEGFADVHDVVVVPVTEHTFGDGGRVCSRSVSTPIFSCPSMSARSNSCHGLPVRETTCISW